MLPTPTTDQTKNMPDRTTSTHATTSTSHVAESLVSLFQSSSNSSLWTNGLPDPDKIRRKMDQRLQQFLTHKYPPLEDGKFRYLREIRLRKDAQNEFYADMSYYESLLETVPVLPLQAESSEASTTTLVPYQPRPKPKRGRPYTGGRKPRPTTRKERRKDSD